MADSPLKTLKASEVLFNDGDTAKSLYIIQKGQLRLFKPKGKGFIEIGVLRSGEVIGEMAYFDDDPQKKRSCSAQAIGVCEVIEIPYGALTKTISGLNPWFKTIVTTLADRMRKMNTRLRELESNSVTHGYGGGASEYEFFRSVDVVKILSILFLAAKGHGENTPKGISIHMNTISFYAFEVFAIQESKFEEFVQMLEKLDYLQRELDKEGLKKVFVIKNLDNLKSITMFFSAQRLVQDHKKLIISHNCQELLEEMIKLLKSDISKPGTQVPLAPLFAMFKERSRPLGIDDLDDARKAGLVGEIIVNKDNQQVVEVYGDKLLKLLPIIRLQNMIKKVNESKN